MKKSTLQGIVLCIVVLFVIFILWMAMLVGFLVPFWITPTTTDTTTTEPTDVPPEGAFYLDRAIGGNTETGLPDGTPMDSDNVDFPYKVTTKLKFTQKDYLSRAAVSGSGTIVLYDYVTEEALETNTFSSGTITTGNNYVSGQHLKFKVTESNYVTYYGQFTVPWWNDNDPSSIDLTTYVWYLATWSQTMEFENKTVIADAGYFNTSTSCTGGLAALVFDNLAAADDTGYATTYNFLKDVGQNAYFALHFVGTGTDSVLISSADMTYGRVVIAADNDFWVFWKLSDLDVSKDLLADGVTRDPDGRYDIGVTLELSGITSGDDVLVTYGIYYYADSAYLRTWSQWAPQNAHGTSVDTFHIYY